MDIALWIIQVILGIKLLTVSYTHGLRQSQPTLQEAIQKLGRLSRPLLFLVAIGAFIGTLGLILPGFLGLSPWIIPLTAGLLSIMLLFSLFFHIKSREKPKIFVSLVLFAMALFVAYGRWVLLP
jgi:putative oxidoreductase